MTIYLNGVEQRNPDTPEEIRDALLSLPDGERKFVITNPAVEEKKIISIAKDEAVDEVVSVGID